ncbi:MAG: LysM peptidoglycan-binding domain-containing protein [Gemmatimonadaceae bacterium]
MGILDEAFGRDDEKKAKADFSNVQSGSSSTAPAPRPADRPAPSAPVAEPSARTYTVKAGDNLSKIAKEVYGDASQWRRIHEANKDIVKNPDLIHPGQTLKLP